MAKSIKSTGKKPVKAVAKPVAKPVKPAAPVKSMKKTATSVSDIDALFASGVPSVGFVHLPEGDYEGRIKAGSAVIETKDNGGHRMTLTLQTTSPSKYVNREERYYCDLSTQVGVNIFLGLLETLQLGKPTSLAEAAELLAQTDDLLVKFHVAAAKDDYPPKVYINERLEEGEGNVGEEENTGITADDIQTMGANEDEEGLRGIIDENALDVNPDEYDTWAEVADAIVAELGLE